MSRNNLLRPEAPYPYQNPHTASPSIFASNMAFITNEVDTKGVQIKKDEITSMSFLNHIALNVSFNEIDVSATAQLAQDKGKLKTLEKDANDDIFTLWPLLTRAVLAKQGMHTQFLRHKDPNWDYFTASGSPIVKDENCRKQVRTAFLTDGNAQFGFNDALNSLMSMAFDMSTIDGPDLNKTHNAAHKLQKLWILFFNRCQYAKSAITNDFQLIQVRPVTSVTDLVNLSSEISNFSILFNILDGHPPVSSNSGPVVQQLLETLQRGAHLLPASVQPAFNKGLITLQARVDDKDSVSSTSLLIHLTPVLPTGDKSEAAFSAASTMEFHPTTDSAMHPPVFSGPSETAFVAQLRDRQSLKPPDHLRKDGQRRDTPRQDNVRRDVPRQDNVRRAVPVDPRPDYERRDTRRDIRQEYERGNARPESLRPRNYDPPSSASTLESMQKTMADLQSQIDKHARQSRRDDPNKSNRIAFASAHMASAKATSASDDPDDQESAFYAFGSRVEYCSDDLPCPLGASRLRGDFYSDDATSL